MLAIAVLTFVAVGLARAGAAPRPRHRQRRRRADHRLPVRARTRHADVDHGRRRPRRAGRRADQERRSDRADGKSDTLVVDKTGTLTEGKPRLTKIMPAAGITEEELLAAAAAVEAAQRTSARRRDRAAAPRAWHRCREPSSDFESTTGGGVSGDVDGRRVLVGKPAFLREQRRQRPRQTRSTSRGAAGGRPDGAIFVAIDGRAAGILAVADPIKESTAGGDRATASSSA